MLVYEARGGGRTVTPGAMTATIAIMRKRADSVAASSVVRQSAPSRITVELAGSSSPREPLIAESTQLLFYDWEPNVIGANGKPAPSEATATGGQQAGAAPFGLPEYQAVLRAKKRVPILRKTDTTWSKGCTPMQEGGCIYGSWYLLDTAHEKLIGGPDETKRMLYSDLKANEKLQGAKLKAVRVNPGTVLVQALPIETASGKVTQRTPNSWYVLNDDPALTGADIRDPMQSFDEGPGGKGAPDVTFGFTPHGKSVFERVTKEIAHRGRKAGLPGVVTSLQHFAVVLDGQLITVPFIDYTVYPEGINASAGSAISGGFTMSGARELAAVLGSGPLPLRLVLVSRAQR